MSFASLADYRECEKLHRKFGTTYYFATKQFPKAVQNQVHAVYGFVRVPDEWVDNPGALSLDDQKRLLDDWRRQLVDGIEGKRPESGVMRAFVDTFSEVRMCVEEPLVFLDAMEMDLEIRQYETYEDLAGYMRGSAAAVGLMMLSVLEDAMPPEQVEAAKRLGDAMQMTNFLRDVAEDIRRGRVYLPLEDMDRFGVSVDQIREGRFDAGFADLMAFEIERTRQLYALADPGIRRLSPASRRAVLLARVLYSQILDEIEKLGGNVFLKRARTGKAQKLWAASRVVWNAEKVLDELGTQRVCDLPGPIETQH